MQKSLKAAVFLAFFSFIQQAHSALLVEPVLGYNVSTTLDFENGDKYSGGTGLGIGGRLGYQNLGFQLGLDYLHSSIDLDDNDFSENVTMDEYAAFVGFEFPVFFRVYAGYIFAATGETKNAADTKIEFSKGSGTKIGVGFTGLPFIDINVEYRSGSFGEAEAAGVTDKDDTKYKSVLLALSLPFTL